MLVVEKAHHIKAHITGEGAEIIADLVRKKFPDAETIEDDGELFEWKKTDLAQDIKAMKTPGKVLKAYRERAGFSLVELAEKIGTKYPNLSAMENDRRVIGLHMARKLGKALNVDFNKFIQ
jgi:plasmid maintenance system antidote protein VapI